MLSWLNLFGPKARLYLDTALNAPWPVVETPDTELPHMTRLAWALEDRDGELVRYASHLIRLPHGVSMDGATASSVLIFDGMLEARGMPLGDVLVEFVEALADAGTIVAHNWRRQQQVLDRSMCHAAMPAVRWKAKRFHCTREAGAELIGNHRPPTFDEIASYTLGKPSAVHPDPLREGDRRIAILREFRDQALRHVPPARQPHRADRF